MRATALPLAGLLLTACAGEADDRPSVVLVTLDTTRTAALGCYGNTRGATPRLDAFARESVLFEEARTVAPITLPAHASMLTGLYPPRHGVRDNGIYVLTEAASTLAELAAEAGYDTAAFVAAMVLHEGYGLAQGFATFDAPGSTAGRSATRISELPAEEVNRRALRWLAERDGDRPMLLWVHYFDPHEPLQPKEPFLSQVGGRPYLAEVAAMDHAFGALLDALEAEDLLDRSLVLVVGDHGEDFGQHGEPTHSVTCYDTTMRVPFLVRYPDGWEAGTRSAAPVSVADVFPTAADAMGLETPADLDGRSLYRRAPDAGRGVYFESLAGYLNYGWSPLLGWFDSDGKYLHSSAPELYDIRRDPAERSNLLPQAQERAARYRSAIAEVLARPVLPAQRRAELDAQALADLRSLGYAAAASGEEDLDDLLAETGRPSPHQRTDELRSFYEAVQLGAAGRRGEAIAALRALTRDNPGNVYAWDILGLYLYQEGELEEASRILEGLLEISPGRATTYDVLGHCAEGLGRREEARRYFLAAQERNPGDPHFQQDLDRLARGGG